MTQHIVQIVEFPLRYTHGTVFNEDEDRQLSRNAIDWMNKNRNGAVQRLSALYSDGYTLAHEPLVVTAQRQHVGSRFSTIDEIVLLVYTLVKLPDSG